MNKELESFLEKADVDSREVRNATHRAEQYMKAAHVLLSTSVHVEATVDQLALAQLIATADLVKK